MIIGLKSALDLLDLDTPDQVAKLLRSAGVKGNHVGGSCPLAQYLTAQVGRPIWVTMLRANFVGGSRCEGPVLPTAAIAFVGRFDTGTYPDLFDPMEQED